MGAGLEARGAGEAGKKKQMGAGAGATGAGGMHYCDYWRLAAPPFDNLPDPRFYVPSGQHEEARQRLLYGLQAMKGLVMLTGEIGCGKTLTSRALTRRLPKDEYDVALIAHPSLPAPDFFAEILYQFGLDTAGSKGEQLRRLNEHVLANWTRRVKTILMVDEAQSVPDASTYEDLRLLLNFQLNDRFLITLALVGQPELNERVAAVPQLNQRVAVRAHLGPLSAEETRQYVRGRLLAAGGKPEVFTKEAVQAVHAVAGGVCRLINHLCDLCLFLGAQERLTEIPPALVQHVHRIS